MPKNNIPVNSMSENFSEGISIDQISFKKSYLKTVAQYVVAENSHRDQGHTFHILKKGTIHIEIDFQKHSITAPSVVYMHPNQVHRILDFTDMTVCSLSLTTENLNPDYLTFLEDIAPAMPLSLLKENHEIAANLFSLSLDFASKKNNKLYFPLLKDSCNTLVAFLVSQFLKHTKPEAKLSRFEIISKAFTQLLEKEYCTLKRAGEYANKLNISAPYLNECIKNTTGYSATQHIQTRIILEAKRLLYHTDKSVKEIAFDLGYEDYPYFSKLFSKVTGMTALTFRNKNHE